MYFLPFAAPSTGAFAENGPKGVRQGGRTSAEGQEPLLLTLGKKRGAQDVSGNWAAFLLDTFLWRSKEK